MKKLSGEMSLKEYFFLVDMIDQDGQSLSILSLQGINCPRCLCVDEENNLHVGQQFSNTVTVYKYLQ